MAWFAWRVLAIWLALALLTASSAAPADRPTLLLQLGHTEQINAVAFSPDGGRLASASKDRTLRLWDTQSGRLLAVFTGHTEPVLSVAFSSDGRHIASSSADGTVRLWDAHAGSLLAVLKALADSVVFSPDGKYLAAGGNQGIWLWNNAGELRTRLADNYLDHHALAFSPDGSMLAAASGSVVTLWDTTAGLPARVLSGPDQGALSLAFSPNGRQIIVANDETLNLWDATSGKLLKTLWGQHWRAIALHPGGKLLAAAGEYGAINLWDITSGEPQGTLAGHYNGVTSLAFSRDGKRLASGSYDDTIRLWNVAAGKGLLKLGGGGHNLVFTVAFSPDGRYLASGEANGIARVWRPAEGTLDRTLQGHNVGVFGLAFSPDGGQLATGSDNTIKLWDVRTGQELAALQDRSSGIHQLAFSPDGRFIASANWEARLFELATGRMIRVLPGHGLTSSVAFSPDGKQLAAGGIYGVHLWDPASGRLLYTPDGPVGKVKAVAYSPGGLLAMADCCSVHVWDAAAHVRVATLVTEAPANIEAVAFRRDGRQLAVAGDQVISLWTLPESRRQAVLTGHTGLVRSVTYDATGTRLASAAHDGTLRLWDAQAGAELGALLAFGLGDWLFYTPDGRLDSTAGARKYISWRVGSRVLDFSELAPRMQVSGLMARLWKGGATAR